MKMYLLASASLSVAVMCFWHLEGLARIILCPCFLGLGLYTIFSRPTQARPVAVKLCGFTWTTEDFCRGWLITGDTGSGKTRSGITPLLFQIFENVPNWGGLCIDDKGLYWETLSEMAEHFGRSGDLILLQVRPEHASPEWKPLHAYNLVSDPSIPFTTYAKAVVDTASSLGQQGNQSFFKQQAQTHIAMGLDLLDCIGDLPTLDNVHKLLLEEEELARALLDVSSSSAPRNVRLGNHFNQRYKNQPPEQMGGVKETIANYLQPFLAPAMVEVFCPEENTFSFDDLDRGKIVCLAMPQKFQTERRYVATFLKLLFYTHLLKRFDKSKAERKKDNLLILWADEAQRFVTAAEDGQSDYNCVDVIREAKGTIVAAAQSSTSFIPPLGREKTQVFTLNLRNRLIFKAADEEGAKESADFLGTRTVIKRSWGYSGGRGSRNYAEQDEHKIKPSALRSLRKHQCVLVHCELGFKKTIIPPIEPDGETCSWYCPRV